MLEKMIIGTVQFGLDYGVNAASAKKMSQDTCDQILDIAWANGINTLDTAEIYGDSIDKIGHYQKANHQFDIISKFHLPENVFNTLSASLSRLSADHYLCIHAHRPEQLFTASTVQDDLLRLRDSGLTKYIGVSIYTNEEFIAAIESPVVDVIQFPFNLLDNMTQRGELMKRAKKAGKILHARSAYLQGMLLKSLPLPVKLQPLERNLESLNDICRRYDLTMPELALEYVFSNDLIDNVVIGHHSPAQLSANIAMIKNFKAGAYLKEIDEINVKDALLLNPRNW